MSHIFKQISMGILFGIGLMIGPLGCLTPSENPVLVKNHGRKVRYELTPHQPVASQTPLPTRTDYTLTWTYEDGFEESYIGYLAWDFNDDGRFEMVEEIDPKGKRVSQIFDFNGDGVVDRMVPEISQAVEK